jgi:hypothetical protein
MEELNDEHVLQLVRITIDGETYTMFAPPIVADNEEVGNIEDLEFGEFVPIRHIVSELLNCLNNTVH